MLAIAALVNARLGSVALASTYLVAADGSGDFATIAPAIAQAASGDSILIAAGRYAGPDNRNLHIEGKSLAILGMPGQAKPVLDCESQGQAFSIWDSPDPGVSLQGLRIVHGDARELEYFLGGAILCYRSSLDVTAVEIDSCAAITGGAIYWEVQAAESLKVESTAIGHCLGDYEAGGIYAYSANGLGAVRLRASTIASCAAEWGGGMYAGSLISLDLQATQFIANAAEQYGGGIFAGVTAQGMTIVDCEFINNTPGYKAAGGFIGGGSSVIVSRSRFSGNQANGPGGGLYAYEVDSLLVEDTSFASCQGSMGVALLVRYVPRGAVNRCTFVLNEAILWPCLFVGMGCTIAVDACVFANNIGDEAICTDYGSVCTFRCSTFFANEGSDVCSAVPPPSPADGNLFVDPLFCDLAAGDFSLRADSPCLPANNDCGVQMGAFGEGCTLTGVGEASPPGALLGANYPNPFNPSTAIPFSLEKPTAVTLSIHDISGRLR
ncbi:MAG: hypothetical protein FJX72_13925, partial [Armatimonadetes bacterium]|nr:hypothetical protein [Armatimonadota bacterium]